MQWIKKSLYNLNYDSNEIGIWSSWQGDLNAKIIIIGQDWGDVKYFEENKGKDKDDNPTYVNLIKLLRIIGYHIDLQSFPFPIFCIYCYSSTVENGKYFCPIIYECLSSARGLTISCVVRKEDGTGVYEFDFLDSRGKSV